MHYTGRMCCSLQLLLTGRPYCNLRNNRYNLEGKKHSAPRATPGHSLAGCYFIGINGAITFSPLKYCKLKMHFVISEAVCQTQFMTS